ncbi:LysR family transcriptional regulator [Streptomyces sp. NPDC059740]|uniref:LysR family transcriptional regulator n=1 Tax=Streptomyces sp. NPDC059740 TaxID=3346926 RepID=UPI00365C9EA2
MDTRILRTFVTLAATRSFTAAADELHLAQSTVTVHIRSLEKDLGSRLFDRLPSGAVLTSAGRRLLTEAAALLDAEARLRATAAASGEPAGAAVSGEVTVGAGESLCATRLPGVLAALRRSHPGIDVHLLQLGTRAAVEAVRAGRVDLALLMEPEVSEGDLVARRIGEEPVVYLAAAGHPLAGRPVGWEELAREEFFVHEAGCVYSDRLVRALLSLPVPPPRLTRFGGIEATRACVVAGLGLTVLPRATVERDLRAGLLAEVAGPPAEPAPVLLARHRRRWVSPAAAVVAEALTRGAAGSPDRGPGDAGAVD